MRRFVRSEYLISVAPLLALGSVVLLQHGELVTRQCQLVWNANNAIVSSMTINARLSLLLSPSFGSPKEVIMRSFWTPKT